MPLKLDQLFKIQSSRVSGCVKHNFEKVGIISYSKDIDDFESFFNHCAILNAEDIIEIDKTYDVHVKVELLNEVIFKLKININ